MIHDCLPCQYGDHDGHYEVVQAVPEGVMGGAVCLCKGECRDRPRADVSIAATGPETGDSIDAWTELVKADGAEGGTER